MSRYARVIGQTGNTNQVESAECGETEAIVKERLARFKDDKELLIELVERDLLDYSSACEALGRLELNIRRAKERLAKMKKGSK